MVPMHLGQAAEQLLFRCNGSVRLLGQEGRKLIPSFTPREEVSQRLEAFGIASEAVAKRAPDFDGPVGNRLLFGENAGYLGEIAASVRTIRREARTLGK